MNERIEELIERIDNLRSRYIRDYAYTSDLNLRQLEALLYLSKCNRYSDTPIAMAEYLGITKGTISQTIISLEKKNLLRKRHDKRDKRIVHIELAKKGKQIVKECLKNSPLMKTIDKNLSNKDFNNSVAVLEELLATMQSANSYKTFGVCKTCSYFRKKEKGKKAQCGLTLEPLTEKDSLKICREHLSG